MQVKQKKTAWCYYDNDVQKNPTYGKLYNWYAVADPRGICPAGWHVPSDDEFQLLVDYLGGRQVAGGKMKAQTLWQRPNAGADNSSGFTALPAGYRYYDGTFKYFTYGHFWSFTEYNSNAAWHRNLDTYTSCVYHNGFPKVYGLSVRCVRD